MVKKFAKQKLILSIGLVGLAGGMALPGKAQAYDMDCKVILCIAGGFPSECSDAYRYMIQRITRFPNPLPPFGFCAMSDGSEYTAHDVNYRYLNRGPEAYDCPEGKRLFYRREDDDNGWNETAFCYTHTTVQQSGWGDDEQTQVIYHNQSAATRINFELKITIEPGTDVEIQSPLFRINYGTGYVSQHDS